MSSADKQQKPSSQGYDGTGGRRRRSQRLEERRKGISHLLNLLLLLKSLKNINPWIQELSKTKFIGHQLIVIIYAYQRVRARDVQFHRRQHLRQAARWNLEISQALNKSHLSHPSKNRSHFKEPEVPLHLLQYIRSTIQLLQRQVYHLEVLDRMCR